jgi:hypothetical protein
MLTSVAVTIVNSLMNDTKNWFYCSRHFGLLELLHLHYILDLIIIDKITHTY